MAFPALPNQFRSGIATGAHASASVAQFEIGDFRNFVYLILDWEQRQAAWVDPQSDLSSPLAFLRKENFSLQGVLLTHTHWDHIAGVPEILKLFPEIPIWTHPADASRLSPTVRANVHAVSHGQILRIGSLDVEVLHTPGHSPGECCYWLHGREGQNAGYLFTGDTLFIRDCGRTDLEGGSDEEMFESLQKLKRLPPELLVLPGHHYAPECASTLGRECAESPPLRCASPAELSALP